jgi:hypothetical protein
MFGVLIVRRLLSPPLLHAKLLAVLVRAHVRIVQGSCTVSAKHSFIQLNLLVL